METAGDTLLACHFDHASSYHRVFLSGDRAVPASERLKETKKTLPVRHQYGSQERDKRHAYLGLAYPTTEVALEH